MSRGYSKDYILKMRKVWETKPILRKTLNSHHTFIMKHTIPGKILELGGGVGPFKEFSPRRIYSTDLDKNPWIDAGADMTKLRFKSNIFSNIVTINAFHHLRRKDWKKFFKDTYRILKPKGRLILFEPHNSPFSLMIRKMFHKSKKKYPSKYDREIEKLPQTSEITKALRKTKFKIVKIDYFDMLVYPLSGGFHGRSLIPSWSYGLFRSFDYILYPFRKWLTFKFVIVLEK